MKRGGRAIPGLARDSLLNMFGQMIPVAVGIVTLPLLIHGLGATRFGILSLIWAVIAYFTLLDFGIGRALTKVVAGKLGEGNSDDVPALIWLALTIMVVVGATGAVLAYFLSPLLARGALRLPSELTPESISAFRILAVGLPFIVSVSGLHAVLVAYGRFGLLNTLRLPLGVLGYVVPVLAVLVRPDLVAVTAAAVAVHVVSWFAYFAACLRTVPMLTRAAKPSRLDAAELLRFGGWLTVSNVVAPFMLYLDRFLIARMISPAAVAYYATPFGVVTQLWLIPRAVVEALFPTLSAQLAVAPERARASYYRALIYVGLGLIPPTVIIIIFARQGLTIWIGEDFASASFRIAQILAVGVLINSIGLVATSAVQAAGRPDLTAKLHVVEAPFYFIYLSWLLLAYGAIGAALAWVIRVTLSATLLLLLARRCVHDGPPPIRIPPRAVISDAVPAMTQADATL